MKRPARKKLPGAQEADARLLQAYRQLPVDRQKHYLQRIGEEARDRDRVIPFTEILSDPVVLEEARRLARGAGLPLQELAQVINPLQYSSYFARSSRCTMAKLTSVDYGRFAEIAEVIVFVKAYKEVQFRHKVIPVSFDLHVVNGALEIRRGRSLSRAGRGDVIRLAPGAEIAIRAQPGAWFSYVDHPLTALVRARAVG